MPKPIVVIVHGAFHVPEHYEDLISELRAQEYPVKIPRLPSVGAETDSENGLEQDAETVATAIGELTDAGNDMVALFHSYGGVPGTEAVATLREKSKLESPVRERGKILKLIYLAAFVVPKGENVLTQYGEMAGSRSIEVQNGVMHHMAPLETFYNEMPKALADDAVSRIPRMAASPFTALIRYSGWSDYGLPVTYIVCTRDNALPTLIQGKFIERIQAAGVNLTIHYFDSDHSPFLTRAKDIVKVFAEG